MASDEDNETGMQMSTNSENKPQLKIEGISIVLLGSFNPMIFQPAWFGTHGLIRKEAVEGEPDMIITSQISRFTTGEFELIVTQERFHVATVLSSYFDSLRDLVIGTFRLLSHTPILALGLNYDVHYKMPSEESWHQLGHQLAPKANWTILDKPGLRSMVMEGLRKDAYKGHIQVKLEPSTRSQYGVFIGVNSEVRLGEGRLIAVHPDYLDCLPILWPGFLSESQEIIKSLLELS